MQHEPLGRALFLTSLAETLFGLHDAVSSIEIGIYFNQHLHCNTTQETYMQHRCGL
jgi:hypothetical protein